ncbi:MAG: hypothetical protein K6G23_06640 [Lachnospiraceae bacterium]|nr:hypothetical protein [Lachnospiraceae bacterium]
MMHAKERLKNNVFEYAIALITLVVVLLIPFYTGLYQVNVFTYYLICAILGISIYFIWGIAGIFSFGQAAFMGIGGYAYAILSKHFDDPSKCLLYAAVAIAIACAVAAILGYFMFYGGINDVFVGLITMCVTISCQTFMSQTAGSQWQILGVALGGDNGLNDIPGLTIGYYRFNELSLFFLLVILVAAFYIVIKIVEHRKFGYAMLSVRENRTRSELLGYDTAKLQVIVFTIGGGIAALAGVLYCCWGYYITPASMSLKASTIPVVLAAAGGKRSLISVILFTVLYYILSNYLTSAGADTLLMLGALLIVVILVLPQGIFATIIQKLQGLIQKAEA